MRKYFVGGVQSPVLTLRSADSVGGSALIVQWF